MTARAGALALTLIFAGCGGGGDTVPLGPFPDVPGCLTTEVANEGWSHVAEGSAVSYRHDPPASGPHYPTWARYEEFTSAIPRGTYVHNLEHGAIVFLYRPDIPEGTINALRDVYRGLPNDSSCGHKRALFTPDPLMQQQTAVVAADFVLQSNCNDAAAIRAFVSAHRGRGPENVCAQGSRP
jgi:hypothetical protein